MPIHVLVVGAGIAGLACAIALGREGHQVDIFEKSAFSNEVGAAYHSGPYAVRIYKRWGLNIAAMRSLTAESWEDRDCQDPTKILNCQFVLKDKKKACGLDDSLDEIMHHRVDAHRTLRDHALAMPNVKLRLSAAVQRVDAERGVIKLANGEEHAGDLVIGADGVHSRMVAAVDPEAAKSMPTGVNMYRFMVSSKRARSDPDVAALLDSSDFPRRHIRFVHRPTWKSMVMYPCRDGELINCATFQANADDLVQLSDGDYNSPGTVEEVLHIMQGWPTAFKKLASLAEDIKHWAVIHREVPRSTVRGRLALVGDAAHPIQPTWAAGANMGIEDAAVLGVIFASDASASGSKNSSSSPSSCSSSPSLSSSSCTADSVPERLRLFHELRYLRTTTVKYVSEIQNFAFADFKERTVAKIQAHCGGKGQFPEDMIEYLWTFDAVADAERAVMMKA